MLYSKLVNRAIDLAYQAHLGQRDKAGRPYFLHPFHVAEQMDDENSVCVALLHDVLEDTAVTVADLEREFPSEVTEAVQLLTHEKSLDYFEYIKLVSRNPLARKVKLADLAHNLDITRFSGSDAELLKSYHRRAEKYQRARRILNDAMEVEDRKLGEPGR